MSYFHSSINLHVSLQNSNSAQIGVPHLIITTKQAIPYVPFSPLLTSLSLHIQYLRTFSVEGPYIASLRDAAAMHEQKGKKNIIKHGYTVFHICGEAPWKLNREMRHA
jgi:hypothetical protein